LKKSGNFRDIIYGFRPSVIKNHLPFYATLLSVAVFGISIQTFMGYIVYFMESRLKFSLFEYAIVFGLAIRGIWFFPIVLMINLNSHDINALLPL
jgi:uncharacterized membrane protein